MSPWKTLARRIAYENRWIRVREDSVVRPDGRAGIYGVVEVPPSIGVVAMNERYEVVLVGQWRYTLDRYSWEIPRGGSAPGDSDMRKAAERELREEAGLTASQWRKLGAVDVCNGVTTDVQHLYLATGLTQVPPHQDPEERIELRWETLDSAVRMCLAGEISECCSVAALLWAARLMEAQ